jgi:MFS family permease
MRRTAFALYGLILLETVVWVALVPLAPTFARQLGLSKLETGAVLASASFATVVVSLPIGLLADRIGARALTIASAVVLTGSCVGQGLAADFWSLLVSRAAFGLAFGAVWTVGAAWLAETAHASRATALGVTVTVSGLGFALGPAFAGLVGDRFGVGVPFLACAGAAAVATAFLLATPAGGNAARERRRLPATLAGARRETLVVGSLALIMLVGFVGGGVNLLVPLHLRSNGVSAGSTGLLFSAAAGVFTLVSALVARVGARAATLRNGGLWALGLALSLLIVVGSGATVAAVAFVLVRAPFWAAMDTILYPLGAAGAERASLGRGAVLGVINLAWGAAATVGPLVAGAVAQAAGERAAYVLLAGASAATALWLMRAAARARAPALLLGD